MPKEKKPLTYKPSSVPKATTSAPAPSIGREEEEAPKSAAGPTSYLALKSSFEQIKRNPFELPIDFESSGEEQAKKFIVTGIIIDKERRLAIIDGKPVKEGDTISNYKVQKINSDSVDLISLETGEILTIKLAR